MTALAFLGPRDRRRLEQLAATNRTTPAALARDAVRVLIATFTPPRVVRSPELRRSVRPSVQTPCHRIQAPRSLLDVTSPGARPCVVCGEPLPPQGRGRPRVKHPACGGKPLRGAAARVVVPPRPRVEDEFDVTWDGTLGRQGKSLVGDINRRGCTLAQP